MALYLLETGTGESYMSCFSMDSAHVGVFCLVLDFIKAMHAMFLMLFFTMILKTWIEFIFSLF